MKIDNSLLQAGALIAVAVLAINASCHSQWGLVSTCVTGFFAILAIHPKDGQAPPNPQ